MRNKIDVEMKSSSPEQLDLNNLTEVNKNDTSDRDYSAGDELKYGRSKVDKIKWKILNGYAWLIIDYPYAIFLPILVLVVSFGAMSFTLRDFPDLSEPTEGFKPRGTSLGNILISRDNAEEAVGTIFHSWTSKTTYPEGNQSVVEPGDIVFDRKKRESIAILENGYFCGYGPAYDQGRMVFISERADKNLLTPEALHSMCSLESEVVHSHPAYRENCAKNLLTQECCLAHSLGNYIAALGGSSSCRDIDQDSLSRALDTLKECAPYYHDGSLTAYCGFPQFVSQTCQQLPPRCYAENAVFALLHYMVDTEFLSLEHPDNTQVLSAMSYLYLTDRTQLDRIYSDRLHGEGGVGDGTTRLVGVEFHIAFDVFNRYMLIDGQLYGLVAVVVVGVFMWLYIGSLFVTLASLLAVVMSLVMAYFLYMVVFNLPFFPFLNVLTFVVLVGIGADDTFIFCDIWRQVRAERPDSSRRQVMALALEHAVPSMFVTSFTTAAAFISNAVNHVTSVACFGIFASLSILSNFLLTVTWIPSLVALHSRWCECRGFRGWGSACARLAKFFDKMTAMTHKFFGSFLPALVEKTWWLWSVVLLGLAVGALVAILAVPKLKLPSSQEFQLFVLSHPFEQYSQIYKTHFWFEREYSGYDYFPVELIWGVQLGDNGNYLDPQDEGSVIIDPSFDMTSPEAQAWLHALTLDLRNQSFFREFHDYPDGPLASFIQWMEKPCDMYSDPLCCQVSPSEFPYSQDLFTHCLTESVNSGSFSYFNGPKFDEDGRINLLVIAFDTRIQYTQVYEEEERFYNTVEEWLGPWLESAPAGLQNGWFYSWFYFYSLQDSLASGTLLSIGISIALAFLVMLLTTFNLVVSLLAILSIAGTILVTIASLVLLGWELNILESVVMSVAVGLSVDFTVHYGVAYVVSPHPDCRSRTAFSMARTASAITAAALTTFLAGLCVYPSLVLSFRQLGLFLMLMMTVSWVYSTLFFQSLCTKLGPSGRVGNLTYCPCCTQLPQPDPSPQASPSKASVAYQDGLSKAGNGHLAYDNNMFREHYT